MVDPWFNHHITPNSPTPASQLSSIGPQGHRAACRGAHAAAGTAQGSQALHTVDFGDAWSRGGSRLTQESV